MPDRFANGEGAANAVPDDVLLMQRVAAADRAAFDILYRRYAQRVRRFLQRLVRRPTLVEEALNDTMLVVWRRARTFDPAARLSTWILAVAYRKGLQKLRHANVADRHGAASDAACGADPHSVLQQLELRQHVLRALRELPADHRVVVRLVYYHGYACREVARLMRCPVGTVKTRAFHARRKLRTSLAHLRAARQ